jgi:hypothetical protein
VLRGVPSDIQGNKKQKIHALKEIARMTDTVWKCEHSFAGAVCERNLFNSREEAEEFVRKMQRVAPDLFFRIEKMDVKQVWN